MRRLFVAGSLRSDNRCSLGTAPHLCGGSSPACFARWASGWGSVGRANSMSVRHEADGRAGARVKARSLNTWYRSSGSKRAGCAEMDGARPDGVRVGRRRRDGGGRRLAPVVRAACAHNRVGVPPPLNAQAVGERGCGGVGRAERGGRCGKCARRALRSPRRPWMRIPVSDASVFDASHTEKPRTPVGWGTRQSGPAAVCAESRPCPPTARPDRARPMSRARSGSHTCRDPQEDRCTSHPTPMAALPSQGRPS
jgi:hypothetical protein